MLEHHVRWEKRRLAVGLSQLPSKLSDSEINSLWPQQKVSCGDGCGSHTAQPVSQLLLFHCCCPHVLVFASSQFGLSSFAFFSLLWKFQVPEHIFFLIRSVVMVLVCYGGAESSSINCPCFSLTFLTKVKLNCNCQHIILNNGSDLHHLLLLI